MLFVSVVLACVSMGIICDKKNKLYARENNLDDLGLAAKKKNEAASESGESSGAVPPVSAPSYKSKQGTVPFYYYVIAVLVFVFVCLPFGIAGIGLFVAVGIPLFNKAKDKAVNKKIIEVENVKVKSPGMDKLVLCLKPLLGIILSILVWFIAPAADEYYYIAAMVCIAGVLLSFFDITGLHNKLSTRPLPQFDKRGGDE